MEEYLEYLHEGYLRTASPAAGTEDAPYKLNDALFKYIFGRVQCKNILKAFLNSIFDDEHQIEDLTYDNRERTPASGQKGSRFDIRATGTDGKIFHVEIQTTSENFFIQRCFYYATASYFEQFKEGGAYEDLKPVFLVSLMDFIYFRDERDEYSRYRLIEQKTGHAAPDMIELHMFELPKFRKSKRRLTRKIDYWLSYLTSTKKGSDPEMQKLAEYEPAIGDAITMEEDFFEDTRKRIRYILEEIDRNSKARAREREAEEKRKREQEMQKMEQEVRKKEQEVRKKEQEVRSKEQEVRSKEQEVRSKEQEVRKKEQEVREAQKAAKIAKAQGKIEGESKTKIEMARKLLKKGMEVREIAEISELPVEKVKELL